MEKKSALSNFIDRLNDIKIRTRALSKHSIRLGWASKQYDMAAIKKLPRKAKKKAKKMIAAASGRFDGSLASIAFVLNYGREGGFSKKDGHEYGRIPARNFIEVMKRKHMKPVWSTIFKAVMDYENTHSVIDLPKIAVIAKGQLQRSIKDSNEYAPNAPFTINGGWMANPKNGKPFYAKGKGSARPLINTGTLVNSVDFEIKAK